MRIWQKFRRYLQLGPVTRRVLRERLTYLSLEKLSRLERAVKETSGIRGDMLEFGVALGGSGIILASALTGDKRFIGFDVFAMIPPPTSDKDDVKSRRRYEVIASGKSQGIRGDSYYGYRPDLLSDVKASFARYGVPVSDRVVLHKGLFEETWPLAGVESVSLAHIDCDWYDPVRYCLEACADRLSRGGLMIIDDYNDYGGSRTAVDEFMRSRKDFSMERGANPFLRKL